MLLILLFFPNDHLVWAARMPPTPVHGLLARIRSGGWVFPPAWRAHLSRYFDLPDPLPLRARAQGSLIIVTPNVPLVAKSPMPAVDGNLSDLLARLEKEKRRRRRKRGRLED